MKARSHSRRRTTAKMHKSKARVRGVGVKPHSRSPRGPDRGKKRVVVKGHKRSKP